MRDVKCILAFFIIKGFLLQNALFRFSPILLRFLHWLIVDVHCFVHRFLLDRRPELRLSIRITFHGVDRELWTWQYMRSVRQSSRLHKLSKSDDEGTQAKRILFRIELINFKFEFPCLVFIKIQKPRVSNCCG